MAKARFPGVAEDLEREVPGQVIGSEASFYSQHSKRLLDLSIAIPLLLLALPLIVVLALITVIFAGWPPFFAARRIGPHGQEFSMWKIRTMVNGAEDVLKDWLESNPTIAAEYRSQQKLRRDPRLTRFGSALRKLSLDELPQLWNVIVGEMSLVGPRPYIEDELSDQPSFRREVCRTRPGLTGAWQTNGRNIIGPRQRVAIDGVYLAHLSFTRDLGYLAKTFKVLVRPDGL